MAYVISDDCIACGTCIDVCRFLDSLFRRHTNYTFLIKIDSK